MVADAHLRPAPFGRIITAMVTPFTADGELDLDGAQRLAAHLVDAGNDALVISGTTGESPTTSDDEKSQLLRAVAAAVGDRAKVIAGVGTYDTRATLELARAAERDGADALLVVTPYYNRPPQEGLIRHFTAVADATGLPNLLYDIPVRTGTPIAEETLLRLAEHPRIVGVKDAKGDFAALSRTIANTDLAYYCGEDMVNLPVLAVGGSGYVSVASHLATPELRAMTDAYLSGDVVKATEIHHALLPVYTGIFRTQAAILVKAALGMLGLPGGAVRSPLVDATAEQITRLRADLAAGGIHLA